MSRPINPPDDHPRAELLDERSIPPFEQPGWIYEIKFDGYRLIAGVEGGQVQLVTRNGADATNCCRITGSRCRPDPGDPTLSLNAYDDGAKRDRSGTGAMLLSARAWPHWRSDHESHGKPARCVGKQVPAADDSLKHRWSRDLLFHHCKGAQTQPGLHGPYDVLRT